MGADAGELKRQNVDMRPKHFSLPTSLLALGCASLPCFSDQGRINLSCNWTIEQTTWGMSGQILDQKTFTEEDRFVLDEVGMAGWRGGLDGARGRRYRMTFDH